MGDALEDFIGSGSSKQRVSTHFHNCYRGHLDCANVEIERLRKVLLDIRRIEGWHRSLCSCDICAVLGIDGSEGAT